MTEQTKQTSPGERSDTRTHRYSADLAGEIETRWQERWAELGTYTQPNPGEDGFDGSKPKFYCLDMFPYPSGAGLHVGHPEGYTATDIVCRYKRMRGFNVLHPMGWDAFGLPAEQYAIQTGVHPEITTKKAIDNFRRQLQRFGFCYDWSREFGTIDVDYYKWTQWIFLKIYNAWYDTERDKARHIDELVAELESGARPAAFNPDAAEYQGAGNAGEEVMPWASLDGDARRAIIDSYRLAYISLQTVNWCPKLGTALANEEVIDGRSERGGHPVLRKPLRQWMFRITSFADRLLRDLDGLDWPQSTKTQQAEWIGKSVGAEIDFALLGRDGEPTGESLRVFTTRPDTLFGATYMVVAPEHPLVDEVLKAPHAETDEAKLREYVELSRNRSDVERQENKEKTGVYTGVDAINPATGERIPVWTADYVLVTYGSGAIMAVPGHDERDFAFAEAFGLPIREVVLPTTLAAMRYFAGEMTPKEADGDEWASILADFLGYVVSGDIKPSGYADALKVVRTRRTVVDEPESRAVSDAESEAAGGPGRARRGAVRMTWVDAIAEMKIDSPAALRARFGRGHAMDDVYSGSGICVNSTGDGISLDGLPTAEAKRAITAWLADRNLGGEKVNYKLRDWLFSRQRYWGEPFPIVFDEQGHHHAIDESALPVRLPPLADYQPIESEDPTPLLGKATDWLHTTAGEAGVSSLPADAKVVREANTMPGWAGSCWYEIRYCDPKNTERFVGREAESYWMGSGRSALRADTDRTTPNVLDAYSPDSVPTATGFVPRDPYPEGTFGPAEDLMVTMRRLPHFEMERATYFVTWRTEGNSELSDRHRDAVLDALLHFEGARCRVYAACVMPDHVHWIVRPFDGYTLGELVSSVNRYSARKINGSSGTAGSVWQAERFDHIVRDRGDLKRFIDYVAQNPVESGLAEQCNTYPWTYLHKGLFDEQSDPIGPEAVGSESRPTQKGGVDLYIGGAEHAVLHLLYARFWHKALFDLGEVSSNEPFRKLFHQGLIVAHSYQLMSEKKLVPLDEVVRIVQEDGVTTYENGLGDQIPAPEVAPAYQPRHTDEKGRQYYSYHLPTGEQTFPVIAKMSKSLKNVVNPDDVIAEFGADTFRLYEMYMGPLEQAKPWNTRDISGMHRFLQRAWRVCVDESTGAPRVAAEADAGLEKLLHRTIDKVGDDIERLAFNTAIAAMIELVNAATKRAEADGAAFTADQMDRFVRTLAPFAPHVGEEVWAKLGRFEAAGSVALAPWPEVDESQLKDDEVEIAVQIMGKVRSKVMVPADADAKAMEAIALADEKIKAQLEGKTIRKVIAVPGRMVNIVAN